MQSLIKQRRVQFSGPEQDESSITGERIVPQQEAEGGSFLDRLQMQFPSQMSPDYDPQYIEFAISAGAAAFSIHSLEEEEERHRMRMSEDLEQPRTNITIEKEGTGPSSSRITRRSSSKDAKGPGYKWIMLFSFISLHVLQKDITRQPVVPDETFGTKSKEQDRLEREPSRQQSARRMNMAVAADQTQRRNSSRRNDARTKVDTWERDQLEKINKRYQKMNSAILAWENDKKKQAKLKLEKRKAELEQRRTLNQLHYQDKVTRIDHIAEGARKQAEEKRRSKESDVRDKAKRLTSTGKEPVKCFCFRA